MSRLTVDELVSVLNSTGLPVSYYQFPQDKVPPLPYLIYWFPASDDFYADDKNYTKINGLRIELYQEEKDFALEQKIENTLTANGIPYVREETWLQSEEMWMVVFTTSILIPDNTES